MTRPNVTEPKQVQRASRDTVGILVKTQIPRLGRDCVSAMQALGGWMARHGVVPDGPPFWRYAVVNMDDTMQVEVGFTVPAPVQGDETVRAGKLPAGTYVTCVYTGPWDNDGLVLATGGLLEWGERNNIQWDRWDGPDGDTWASRLEWYWTDPDEEPDPQKYQTELAFKTR